MTTKEEKILIQKILNADWSRYEIRKREEGESHLFFVGANEWEINFLIHLFSQQKITISLYQLIWIIKESSKNIKSPQPRTLLVTYIVLRISNLLRQKNFN
ncbi:hypothetical protein OX284_012270 [Flavobacterium sp. SUN046]|uniref:hypothetical protein n=1 Tax=Flavobacterium sp. SUN046 TaxID=3002440 RepID=UPI002DBCE444|nr:hypothetical protein [Flavobacterium sp. SUN046]MEC4050209.1 hypothetical protein [Flavobacterium sp. SUN046]